MSLLKRLYVTYTKKNSETGEVYSGRASGNLSDQNVNDEVAEQILAKRDSSHHKNEDGFDLAKIDVYSFDADATRGREQLLIEHFGGAKSEDGTSGNEINGISHRNKKRDDYLEMAKKIFGAVTILFLISIFGYLLY